MRALGCAAALLAIATGATAAPETRSWEAITAAARGQTVYWNAWAGDERTNAFIAWVGDEVRKRHGVTVQQVKLKDTAEAVTRVVAEKTAGRDRDGSVDLIWINGPNFLAMKEQGPAARPVHAGAAELPPVDVTSKRSNVVDFTVPVDGLESPWRLAQVVYVYDSARHRPDSMPRSINALLDWARAHPGRLTHPTVRNFLGATFLKQALYELAPSAGGAAEPGHRRQLRGDDRAALGLVRQAAADPVARRPRVPRERSGAAPAAERRRDRHADRVQSVGGGDVDRRTSCCRRARASSAWRTARSATPASSRSRTTPRTRKARWWSRTSCSTRSRRRAQQDPTRARQRHACSTSRKLTAAERALFDAEGRRRRRCRRRASSAACCSSRIASWMTRITAEWEKRYSR